MFLRLPLLFCLLVCFLPGCSYHAKPVAQPYYPSETTIIPVKAESSIAGDIELLNGRVESHLFGCSVHSFSVDMKDEFIKSVNNFISSKFISPVSSGKPEEIYHITVVVNDFMAQFDDPHEGSRIAFGMLAGAPQIESTAEISLHIIVKKGGTLLIEDDIKAKGLDVSSSRTCDGIRVSVQKASENLIHATLQEMDKRVFVRLAMKNDNVPINQSPLNAISTEQKLKELDSLQKQGLITNQEYEQKRKDILNKL